MAAADERQDARVTLAFLRRKQESASGRSARLLLVETAEKVGRNTTTTYSKAL
jgi:hypothetical protein